MAGFPPDKREEHLAAYARGFNKMDFATDSDRRDAATGLAQNIYKPLFEKVELAEAGISQGAAAQLKQMGYNSAEKHVISDEHGNAVEQSVIMARNQEDAEKIAILTGGTELTPDRILDFHLSRQCDEFAAALYQSRLDPDSAGRRMHENFSRAMELTGKESEYPGNEENDPKTVDFRWLEETKSEESRKRALDFLAEESWENSLKAMDQLKKKEGWEAYTAVRAASNAMMEPYRENMAHAVEYGSLATYRAAAAGMEEASAYFAHAVENRAGFIEDPGYSEKPELPDRFEDLQGSRGTPRQGRPGHGGPLRRHGRERGHRRPRHTGKDGRALEESGAHRELQLQTGPGTRVQGDDAPRPGNGLPDHTQTVGRTGGPKMPRTNTLEHPREELDYEQEGKSYPGSRAEGWRDSDFKSDMEGRAGDVLDHRLNPLAGYDPEGSRQLAHSLTDNMERLEFPTQNERWDASRELSHRLFEPSRERLELEDAALEPVMGRALASARMPGDGAVDRAERLETYQDRMSELLYQRDLGPDFKAREIEQILNDAQQYVQGGEIEPEDRTSYGYDSVRRMENEALRDMAAESDVRAVWTPVDNAVNALHHRGDTDAYPASRAAEEVLMTNARLASEAVEQGDESTYETVMDRTAWKAEKLARAIEQGSGMAGGEGYNAPPAPERGHGVREQIVYIVQVESRLDNTDTSFDEIDTLRRLAAEYRQLLEYAAAQEQDTGYEDPQPGGEQNGMDAGTDARMDPGTEAEIRAWLSQEKEANAGREEVRPAGNREEMESLHEQAEVIDYLMRPREN